MANPQPTRFFLTGDPMVIIACDYNPDDQEYNLNCREIRLQDATVHGVQTQARMNVRAAVHSYVHATPRPDVRPLFQVGSDRTGPAGGAGRRSVERARFVPGVYWLMGLAGGGVIAIVELGGGWVQSDMDQFFGGDRPAGSEYHRRFGRRD